MNIPEKIFKSYDIRGIYPDDLNEENIVVIAKAVYAFFLQKFPDKKILKIVIGRDMRLSSPQHFKAVSEALKACGAEVIDPGVVSTPTFYFTVFHHQYDAGIQITASHNPKQWAGMKFVMYTPEGLLKIGGSTGMLDIKRMSLAGENAPEMEGGSITKLDSALAEEFKNAQEVAGNPEIKPFKVVADTANAMGAPYIEEVYKNIPGELIKMNFELDGSFPSHEANPMKAETLVGVQQRIRDENADWGIATDGDGDRIYFLDERGEVVPPSIVTALIARELLKKNGGGKIVADLKYILNTKKVVEENGGELIVWKTGHAFITQKIQETGALFAGEASGHYYFKATGGAEASMPVILIILSVMSRENKKLSEIAEEFRAAKESGEINFEVEDAKAMIEALKEKYPDGKISELDGVMIEYPTYRISLRSSNTEPLLRLNVEEDLNDVQNRHEDIVKFILERGGKPEQQHH